MTTKILVRRNDYHDSMVLMQINHQIIGMPGIVRSAILMATENNKPLLKDYGFFDKNISDAQANDLVICLEATDDKTLDEAVSLIEEFLREKWKRQRRGRRFASLESACESFQGSNLAVISVPGQFAGREARKALERNLNVFLFSDNVSLEEEIELKRLAIKKNLLMMGPDCGTAIINGVGLGFANSVQDGPIGIVGASGSGIQELCTILERFGNLGISHAIGIGGRDVSETVQGMGAVQGLELLDQDKETKCIIFISKPPGQNVSLKILEKVEKLNKPVVICFLGKTLNDYPGRANKNTYIVESIEQAALKATEVLGSRMNLEIIRSSEELEFLAQAEAKKLTRDQQFIRAIFSGGSLCYESMMLFSRCVNRLYSNISMPGFKRLENRFISMENTFLDMGDDEWTRGRVHPMIDPTLIAERIRFEGKNPTVRVILFDVALGYGTHPDPASILVPAIMDAKQESETNNRYLVVVAHVCGTEGDPQDTLKQEEQLTRAGALVLQTNLQATKLALSILRAQPK